MDANYLSIFQSRLLLYAALASLALLLVTAVRLSRFRGRVIQGRRPKPRDYIREIGYSITTVAVFSAASFLVVLGSDQGWMRLDVTNDYSVLYCCVTLFFMLLAQDTYFYWTHRWMHRPRVFKVVHRTHHKSVSPSPFAAYSFDIPEAVIHAAFFPLWFSVVTTPMVVVEFYAILILVRNVLGHSDVEIQPKGTVNSPLLDQLTTTTHHDLHHSGKYAHNFGLYFTWWDRLMGTEHPRYKELFREITSRAPEPASALAGEQARQPAV